MKVKRHRILVLAICALFLFNDVSFACTSLIVGKDASETGYAMFSRTEDSVSYNAKRFFVYPAGYYKQGETIVDPSYGWSWTWTHDSYRMTATPDMPVNGPNKYDQAGVNEHGFLMSTTNTTTINDKVKAVDPLLREGGFAESLMNTVILGEAANSAEAIELFGQIAENDGMSEMCFWMMCDAEGELWIAENCGGHRWVAARVPDDSITIVANDNVIDYVDLTDTANYRGSDDLIQFAVDNGFAVYGPAGTEYEDQVNIAASYGKLNSTGSSYRRWIGYHMFVPSMNIALKAADDPIPYPTFVKPDKKISALDVMEFQRSRFEGTIYDISESPQVFATRQVPDVNMLRETETAQIPSPDGNSMITARPIGHYTQKEAHTYEWLPELPPEIGARWWFIVGQPEHSVNLPFYGNITDTHPAYQKEVPYRAYDPESAFWIFRELSYLARSNRKQYGKPVHEYWHNYEKKLYDEQAAITKELIAKHNANPEEAAQWITDYTMATAQAAMNRAGVIRKALLKHIETSPGELFVVPDDSVAFMDATYDIHPTAGTANIDNEKLEEIAVALDLNASDLQPASLVLPDPYPLQEYTPILYTTEENGSNITLDGALNETDKISVMKVRYTFELQGSDYASYGNSLDTVKKNFHVDVTLPGASQAVQLIGPSGLTTLEDAIANGQAYLIGDSNRATVMFDYYIADAEGEAVGGENSLLIVPDGSEDNALTTGTLQAAATGPVHHSGGGGGCNSAPFSLLALLGLAFIPALRKRMR